MKKHLTTAGTLLGLFLGISPRVVFAKGDLSQEEASSIFGTIDKPEAVAKYDLASEGGMGLVLFLSNIIRVATVVAGIWVMINIILAGWTYITSNGDSKANADAMSKISFSLIGLAIIVGSYTLAAIIGLIFFGSASYILSPTITGPDGAGG